MRLETYDEATGYGFRSVVRIAAVHSVPLLVSSSTELPRAGVGVLCSCTSGRAWVGNVLLDWIRKTENIDCAMVCSQQS